MPVKYISHIPNTVEGQAVLDNFVRTRRVLRYRDNNKVYDRIKRGLPLYEVKKIESVGNNPKNIIMRGECLSACAYLKDKGIKVDLVYVDPPFASGADYAKKVYIRRNPKLAEKIAKAEEKLDIEELRAFEEKMYGDIWNKEDYLNWLYENLVAIKSIMSDTGSIFLHLDHHIGHYAKVIMDEVFGEDNFLNEIIWHFRTYQGQVKNYFPRKHNNIFWYKVGYDKNAFDLQYSEEYEHTVDFQRWKEFLVNGNEIRGDKFPTTDSRFDGYINRWKKTNPGKEPTSDDIIMKVQGYVVDDVWVDIQAIDPKDLDEKVDYATQKPESLLDRIIKSSSTEGMLIADFFGGSGVTAKVSNDLKRNFIHVDVGINSIHTTRDRLTESKAEFDVLEIKDGISLFRNPIQTMNKLKSLITGLRNEDSLDSFWEGAINDSKLGLVPVYVPNLLDHSTKVLDKPMMNRIINEAIPDLPDNTKQVIVFYIDIDDEKELNKFIDEYNNTDVKIVLRDLKEILDEVVINDIVEFTINENEIEFNKFLSDRLMQKINEYNQKKGLNGKNKTILDVIEENGTEENGDDEVDHIDDNGNDEETETEEKTKKKKFVPIEISETGLELIEMISLDCSNKEGIWKSDYEIKIDKNGYLIKNGQKTKEFWDGKISSEKTPLRMKVRNIAGDETEIIISANKSNTETKVKSKAKKK